MRQNEGSETSEKHVLFKDAQIKRLMKARLTHKQALTGSAVEQCNVLLGWMLADVMTSLNNYDSFPHKKLTAEHFAIASKKWRNTAKWEKEKQKLIGALQAIEGAASLWHSQED